MFLNNKFKTNRSIIRQERLLACKISESINNFLEIPALIALKKLYVNRERILKKQSTLKIKRKKVQESQCWGDGFREFFYFWPEDEYREILSKIDTEIGSLINDLRFKLTYEQLKALQAMADSCKKNKKILNDEDRNILKYFELPSESDARSIVMIASIFGGVSFLGTIIDSGIQSSMVFSSLRRVNSNYENCSDFDIWFRTLVLDIVDPSAHQGLVNLAKGAYFEQLIACDTGGMLHEKFNTPDTDITINGVLYQIKATNSASIIDSVEPSVDIISTTEIAQRTRAIDSGHSNQDVTSQTESALGGDSFDSSSALSDGAFVFSGSIGIIAVLLGLAAAGEHLEKNPKAKTGDDFEDFASDITELAEALYIGSVRTLTVAAVSTKKIWNYAVVLFSCFLNVTYCVYSLFTSKR